MICGSRQKKQCERWYLFFPSIVIYLLYLYYYKKLYTKPQHHESN
jgi:hypothetical protein